MSINQISEAIGYHFTSRWNGPIKTSICNNIFHPIISFALFCAITSLSTGEYFPSKGIQTHKFLNFVKTIYGKVSLKFIFTWFLSYILRILHEKSWSTKKSTSECCDTKRRVNKKNCTKHGVFSISYVFRDSFQLCPIRFLIM